MRHIYFGNFSIRFWEKKKQSIFNWEWVLLHMQGILCPGIISNRKELNQGKIGYPWFTKHLILSSFIDMR